MNYDVITVGGGLAGSAVAQALANSSRRVLVLERETEFRDRVRGEQRHPWGVSAARTLGIYGFVGRELRQPDAVLDDVPRAGSHPNR